MISEQALELAVQRGVLTGNQAGALKRVEAELAASALEPPDQEKLRFVSGFGDIFVTIGLVLFLGAIAHFAYAWDGATGRGLALSGASWLLAEYFTRIRRMALPSIVLLIAFAGAVFYLAASIVVDVPFDLVRGGPGAGPAGLAISAAAMGAGAALHYWRFRVPITIAAGAAAAVLLVVAAVGAGGREPALLLNPVLFVCGLLVFAAAMRFDALDPLRQTRRTDIAFWLHLLAAPLIVHPLIEGIWSGADLTAAAAIAILAVFLGLGAIAVLVNRRAILVSGLSYAGFAFLALVENAGLADTATPLTLLALGAFVLLLSAGWTRVRKAMLRLLPARLRETLPPDLAAA